MVTSYSFIQELILNISPFGHDGGGFGAVETFQDPEAEVYCEASSK